MRLLVCVGEDCRDAAGAEKVMDIATNVDCASTVTCQGICKGPVVGVEHKGEIRWYTKVRGGRLRSLTRLLRTGSGRGALRSAEERKRRGKLKHPSKVRPLRQR